jgi:hypothetical protein
MGDYRIIKIDNENGLIGQSLYDTSGQTVTFSGITSSTPFVGDGSTLTGVITGATNLGGASNIFSSVDGKILQFNTITGTSNNKVTTNVVSNLLQLDVDEPQMTLWPLVVTGNKLISGGASFLSGLDFSVSALEYIIRSTIYNTSGQTVTLTSGDTSFDRIDVIYADDNETVGVITGVPSANPVKPEVSNLQVEVTFVTVSAGATSPAVTVTKIYDEATGIGGGEWDTTASDNAFVITGSTTQAFSGTKAVEFINGNLTHYVNFNNPTPYDTGDDNIISFYTWVPIGGWGNKRAISIQFFSGATTNGSVVLTDASFGFDATNEETWQVISVPLGNFGMSTNEVTDIRFEVVASSGSGGAGSIDIIFDLIRFQQGAPTVSPQNLWLSFKADDNNLAIAENSSEQLILAGGDNLTTSINSKTVTFDVDQNPTFTTITTSGETVSGFYASDGELLLTIDPTGDINIGKSIIPDTNAPAAGSLSIGDGTHALNSIWSVDYRLKDNSGNDAITITAPSDVFITSPDPVYNFVFPQTTGGTGTLLGVYDYGASTTNGGPSDRAMNMGWFSINQGTNISLDTSYAASGSTLTINSTASGSDTYVTGATYNNGTLFFSGNSVPTTFNVDVNGLLDNTNNYVTGGTYNSGTLFFSGNSVDTTFNVDVNGLLDDTNFYVTGGTVSGINDNTNTGTIDLTYIGVTDGTYTLGTQDNYVTGSTFGSNEFILTRNDGTKILELSGGTNITLSNPGGGNQIKIDASGGGGGEANTASNVGVGQGIFSGKTGVNLQFYSLSGGSNTTLTLNGSTIVIDSTGAVAGTGTTSLYLVNKTIETTTDTPVSYSVKGYLETTNDNMESIRWNIGGSDQHASVTFTAPDSGEVMVNYNGYFNDGGGTTETYFGLHTASGQTTTPSEGWMVISSQQELEADRIIDVPFYLNGLTPGQEYTYYFHAISDSTTSSLKAGRYQQAAWSTTENAGPVTLTVIDTGYSGGGSGGGGNVSRTTSSVQTTDATPTELEKIDTLTDNAMNIVEVYVKAYVASAAQWGVWKRTLAVHKVSGTVTIEEINADVDKTSSGLNALSIDFAVNGGDIDLDVTGITSTTIDWESAYEIIL